MRIKKVTANEPAEHRLDSAGSSAAWGRGTRQPYHFIRNEGLKGIEEVKDFRLVRRTAN